MNHADRTIMDGAPLVPGAISTGYLLIDPCNLDDYRFAEPLPMLHCTPASLTKSDAVMPRLIDVTKLTQPQQEALVEVMAVEVCGERPPLGCAWIKAHLTAPALARHITRFLVGPGADGNNVLWRYYDPRVFAMAMFKLSKQQSQALLGPVIEWRFPWCKRWWSVAGPGMESDPLLGIYAVWPNDSQWTSLNRTAQVSRVMVELAYTHGRQSDARCLRMLREVDVRLAVGAQRFHLSDDEALVDYALMNLRYGPEFRHYPKLIIAWHGARDGAELKITVDLAGIFPGYKSCTLNCQSVYIGRCPSLVNPRLSLS